MLALGHTFGRPWPLWIALTAAVLVARCASTSPQAGVSPTAPTELPAIEGPAGTDTAMTRISDSTLAIKIADSTLETMRDSMLIPLPAPWEKPAAESDSSYGGQKSLQHPHSNAQVEPHRTKMAPKDTASKDETVIDILDEEEAARLMAKAMTDLEDAQRLLEAIDREGLDAEAVESLSALRALISDAREAAAAEKPRAAAALAHKALLLAEKLESRSAH